MKNVFLSGKWVLSILAIFTLLFAISCNNNAKKEATAKNPEKESPTVKKAAVVEEKQDSAMFQKKLQLFEKLDLNKDKKISKNEYLSKAAQDFDTLDVNHDGKLTTAESDLVTPMVTSGKDYVTKTEYLAYYTKKFKTLDKNNDGYLVIEEIDIREN